MLAIGSKGAEKAVGMGSNTGWLKRRVKNVKFYPYLGVFYAEWSQVEPAKGYSLSI